VEEEGRGGGEIFRVLDEWMGWIFLEDGEEVAVTTRVPGGGRRGAEVAHVEFCTQG
jgi:hypothetical protein